MEQEPQRDEAAAADERYREQWLASHKRQRDEAAAERARLMLESDEAAAEQAQLMSEKISVSGWISIEEFAERVAPLFPASPISERHKAVVERRRASAPGEPQPTESEHKRLLEDAAVKGDCETHMRLSAWRTDVDDDSRWDYIAKEVFQRDLIEEIIKTAHDLSVPMIQTLGIIDTNPGRESFIDDKGSRKIETALLSRIAGETLATAQAAEEAPAEPPSEHAIIESPTPGSAPPQPTTVAADNLLPAKPDAGAKRKRPGPKPEVLQAVTERMLAVLRSGTRTRDELEGDKGDALAAAYGGSRNTAVKAREEALAQFAAEASFCQS